MTLSVKKYTDIYNEFADKPIKKFSDLATAERRTLALLQESGMQLSETGEVSPIPVRSSRSEYHEDAQIDVRIGTNPKRAGSLAFARFEMYKTVRTVGEYLDACHALQGKPRYKYLADLRWDEKHEFLTVWTNELLASGDFSLEGFSDEQVARVEALRSQ